AGKTPEVRCHVTTHGNSISVTCTEVRRGAHSPRAIRATVGVRRGHRVFAYGTGLLRSLVLRTQSQLHGRYVLSLDRRGYKPLSLVIHI
ncbi:MAG: hypothetical protein M3071_24805, partial [Actinomycetota bacterium]|nr:hypothetical protein [Actinomycetota bacterium]